jgi:tight adherence protein C
MTIFLILGLTLLAASIIVVVRGFAVPRGTGETLQQIGQYGFESDAAPSDDVEERRVDQFATKVGEYLGKRLSWVDEAELRLRLVSAGFYNISTARFLGYQAILAIGLLCFWIWIAGVSGYSTLTFIIGGVIAVALGWFIPAFIVMMYTRRRRESIEYELPEMIDLLIVALEAGVSLPAALRVSAREITGPLGEEMRLTLQEANMGLSPTEALENLGVRADTPSMRMFIRSIVQGETLGISIGQIMRNLAVEMRKRRKAAAEERAQKAPIKMVFPLILLIFPAMLVVLVLPALINIARVLD